jgi:hypothetical protein
MEMLESVAREVGTVVAAGWLLCLVSVVGGTVGAIIYAALQKTLPDHRVQ